MEKNLFELPDYESLLLKYEQDAEQTRASLNNFKGFDSLYPALAKCSQTALVSEDLPDSTVVRGSFTDPKSSEVFKPGPDTPNYDSSTIIEKRQEANTVNMEFNSDRTRPEWAMQDAIAKAKQDIVTGTPPGGDPDDDDGGDGITKELEDGTLPEDTTVDQTEQPIAQPSTTTPSPITNDDSLYEFDVDDDVSGSTEDEDNQPWRNMRNMRTIRPTMPTEESSTPDWVPEEYASPQPSQPQIQQPAPVIDNETQSMIDQFLKQQKEVQAPLGQQKEMEKVQRSTVNNLIKIAREMDFAGKNVESEEIHKVIRKYIGN